jgi:hypothetical protein
MHTNKFEGGSPGAGEEPKRQSKSTTALSSERVKSNHETLTQQRMQHKQMEMVRMGGGVDGRIDCHNQTFVSMWLARSRATDLHKSTVMRLSGQL